MANTKRRQDYIDKYGNMFVPMNVEGGTWNEHFFTTTKFVTLCIILGVLIFLIVYLKGNEATFGQYVMFLGGWFVASFYATRFIIFEEKFYYKMYQELSIHEISSPAVFWNIASIKDTDEGAIITYSDARIGVIVKVERDTITGKDKDFKENHYDAISDFYREVVINKYSFVQLNIMEQAGKDPRLAELSKIVYKSDNPNICKLMELQVGHIKNITHKSLYESDYFLFYTNDVTKVDNIINDITDCVFKLLDGAFISYTFLNSKDVVELVKELYGVNYFNSTQASLQMFSRGDAMMVSPFNINGIVWTTGETQKLNNMEINKLRHITSGVIAETLKADSISLKDTIYREEEKIKIGIDFDSLADSKPKKNRNSLNLNKPNIGNNMNTNNNLDNSIVIDNVPDLNEEFIDF